MKIESHNFTIYLLKEWFDASNSLIEEHGLTEISTQLSDSVFYLMDAKPTSPWWKKYLSIESNLEQVLKGGILFLMVDGRYFAITFGRAYHKLEDSAYEIDFGFRTTLNAIKPVFKSSDVVNLTSGTRSRIQSPMPKDITFFDLEHQENIIKSLVGNVKEIYKSWFSGITGGISVRVTTSCECEKIKDLCKNLLILYKKEDYKKEFPNIDKIIQENDANVVKQLQNQLLNDFNNKGSNISLMPPTIVNYEDVSQFSYKGIGKSLIYSEVNVDDLYILLNKKKKLEMKDLKNIKLQLLNSNEDIVEVYPISRCIVYNTVYKEKTYCLHEGKWYKIDPEFIKNIQTYIDNYLIKNELPDYKHSSEEQYNKEIGNNIGKNLDKSNISLRPYTQVEPCDIYTIKDGYAILYHIKISTKSALLSHLFNQGYNAALLIKQEEQAMNNLKKLLDGDEKFIAPLNDEKIKVVYGIITRKAKDKKLSDLPLFSQLTLYRVLKNFKVIGVDAKCTYVNDLTEPKSKNKVRKKKIEKD